MLFMEGSVEVVEQAVADINGTFCGLCDQWPAIEFLRARGVAIVIAIEWVECAKCCPTRTEGFRGVLEETADIGTNHRYLEERSESKHARNRKTVMRPGTVGVRLACLANIISVSPT